MFCFYCLVDCRGLLVKKKSICYSAKAMIRSFAGDKNQKLSLGSNIQQGNDKIIYSIQYQDILKAAERIRTTGAYVTPVLTSLSLDQMLGGRHRGGEDDDTNRQPQQQQQQQQQQQRAFFKAECLQRTGSFKFRGAANAILCLLEQQQQQKQNEDLHIVSHSAGNHAQGLACATQSLSHLFQKAVQTTIFMPRGAPQAKKRAVQDTYGANINLTDDDPTIRIIEAQRFVDQINNNNKNKQNQKAVLIHPFEDVHVMAGQGTVALEMVEQIPNLDAVIIPVGGGALASSCSIVLRHILGRRVKIILAEPKGYDDTKRSLECGKLVGHSNSSTCTTRSTVADGLKAELGAMQFPILCDLVDGVMVATDQEILTATKLIWERLNVIVEPSAAIGFAILLSEEFQQKYSPKVGIVNVGVILCGGNCDIVNVVRQFEEHLDHPNDG